MSEQTLDSKSILKHLTYLCIEVSPIFGKIGVITDSDVINLVERSRRLRRLELFETLFTITSPIDITVESIDWLANKAKVNPKVNYYLRLQYRKRFSAFADLESIPSNLDLSFK